MLMLMRSVEKEKEANESRENGEMVEETKKKRIRIIITMYQKLLVNQNNSTQ